MEKIGAGPVPRKGILQQQILRDARTPDNLFLSRATAGRVRVILSILSIRHSGKSYLGYLFNKEELS